MPLEVVMAAVYFIMTNNHTYLKTNENRFMITVIGNKIIIEHCLAYPFGPHLYQFMLKGPHVQAYCYNKIFMNKDASTMF